MFVFGGTGRDAKPVTGDLWTLHTKTFVWSKIQTAQTPRATWYHTAETDGIFLYIYGGAGLSKTGAVWASNQLVMFDTRKNSWYVQSRSRFGRFSFVARFDSFRSSSDNVLSHVTCTWNDALPCVFRHSMVFVDNTLILFGGQYMKRVATPNVYELSNAIIRYDLSQWRSSVAFATDCKSVLAPECRAAHSV